MNFLWKHSFSLLCIAVCIWVLNLWRVQRNYRKNAVPLQAKIIDYKLAQNNYFPIFEFEYMGQTMTVDSYSADKNLNEKGMLYTVYYLPGNQNGVFREKDFGVKAWHIAAIVAAVVYVVIDFGFLHK